MYLPLALKNVGLALLLSAPPGQTAARAAMIEQLLFDICPKVIAGEINLADPAQLQPLGMEPTRRRRDRWIDADSGRKQARISIGYRDFGHQRVCQVRFGGRDNARLERFIVEAGERRHWRPDRGPEELGNLISFMFPPGSSEKTSIMFTHWDEFDGLKPATNVGLIVRTDAK